MGSSTFHQTYFMSRFCSLFFQDFFTESKPKIRSLKSVMFIVSFVACYGPHCSNFAGGKSGGDPGACDQTPCCNAAFSRYQGAGRCPDSQENTRSVCMSISLCVAPVYIRMFIVRSQTCRISWCCCMPIREVLKDVPCDAVMVPLGSSNVAESKVFNNSGQCC